MHWVWHLLGYANELQITGPLNQEAFDEKLRNQNDYHSTQALTTYRANHQMSSKTKLSKLRRLMRRNEVGIYLILEQDEHRSEYVADPDRRIRFISNFSGSSAFITVGLNWAELATDSRYYLIAERQLSSDWSIRRLGSPGVVTWDDALIEKAKDLKVNIGVDPRFVDTAVAKKLKAGLKSAGLKLVAIEQNLVDAVWTDKPQLPKTPVFSLGLDHTGKLAAEKIRDLRDDMAAKQVRTYVSYTLEDTAWLLNLRGGDVPYVPIFKSFLMVTADKVTLYLDKSKLPFDLSDHEGVCVKCKPYDSFFVDLQKYPTPMWVPNEGSWAIARALPKGSLWSRASEMNTELSPINLRKAIKNCAEIAGLKESQLKCSVSILKYLAWLGEHIDEGITEYDGGLKLLSIREKMPDFMGNSFETISATGGNASAPHYAPEPHGSAVIKRDQVYLLDSGSQFLQGSTDITRTTHYGQPTPEEIQAYTLVLKGQLAVSSCVFPEGTSGYKLDILARQFLWEEGLDYGHGTGHGIGSYLNIHELPLGIGMTNGPESILKPGHFVSDEPGYYDAGKFGVRLENDILVVKNDKSTDSRQFYEFETLTVVPYEPRLIDTNILTPKEKSVINSYHKKCKEYLEPFLEERYEKDWLERCTKPIQ